MIAVVEVRSYSPTAGQDVGGHRSFQLGLAGPLSAAARGVLVRRVGVRVEQADRHRFDLEPDHRLDRAFDLGLRKGGHHLGPVVDPLLDLDDAVARHQTGRLS